MKRLGVLIFIMLVFTFLPAFAQEVYRWVDEKGTVHFADDLNQIPEKYLDQFQKKKFPQETPPPSVSPSSPAPGAPKVIPKAMPREVKPVSPPPEQKDILGRGEDWWRGQVREWNAKLLAAQKSHEAALTELKNKEKEIGESKFKPDSLKRKLKAEMKALEEKVNGSKKQLEETRNMVERGLPKQAQEYHADPNWLR
ncbi:MAG: DUF4124 domain-containing protein [Deltaproteobacteria bacterium]